jgi:hypothetical protein
MSTAAVTTEIDPLEGKLRRTHCRRYQPNVLALQKTNTLPTHNVIWLESRTYRLNAYKEKTIFNTYSVKILNTIGTRPLKRPMLIGKTSHLRYKLIKRLRIIQVCHLYKSFGGSELLQHLLVGKLIVFATEVLQVGCR